jgi:hypothetical protein
VTKDKIVGDIGKLISLLEQQEEIQKQISQLINANVSLNFGGNPELSDIKQVMDRVKRLENEAARRYPFAFVPHVTAKETCRRKLMLYYADKYMPNYQALKNTHKVSLPELRRKLELVQGEAGSYEFEAAEVLLEIMVNVIGRLSQQKYGKSVVGSTFFRTPSDIRVPIWAAELISVFRNKGYSIEENIIILDDRKTDHKFYTCKLEISVDLK